MWFFSDCFVDERIILCVKFYQNIVLVNNKILITLYVIEVIKYICEIIIIINHIYDERVFYNGV